MVENGRCLTPMLTERLCQTSLSCILTEGWRSGLAYKSHHGVEQEFIYAQYWVMRLFPSTLLLWDRTQSSVRVQGTVRSSLSGPCSHGCPKTQVGSREDGSNHEVVPALGTEHLPGYRDRTSPCLWCPHYAVWQSLPTVSSRKLPEPQSRPPGRRMQSSPWHQCPVLHLFVIVKGCEKKIVGGIKHPIQKERLSNNNNLSGIQKRKHESKSSSSLQICTGE